MSNPSWWFAPGELVSHSDTRRIGVVMAVKEPGIIQVRWGTDVHAGWYDMNDFYRVKVTA
jgi:hypothetical protein